MTEKGEGKKALTELRSNFDAFFIFAVVDGKAKMMLYQEKQGQIEDCIFDCLAYDQAIYDMFDALLDEVSEMDDDDDLFRMGLN